MDIDRDDDSVLDVYFVSLCCTVSRLHLSQVHIENEDVRIRSTIPSIGCTVLCFLQRYFQCFIDLIINTKLHNIIHNTFIPHSLIYTHIKLNMMPLYKVFWICNDIVKNY